MTLYPQPYNESERLAELRTLNIANTTDDEYLKDVVHVLADTFHPAIAAITLIDENIQWFKSIYGSDIRKLSRETAICNYTIMQDEVMEVQNLNEDVRFRNIYFVKNHPNYVYYAGIPIVSSHGYKLGTICIIDNKAHHLTPKEKHLLRVMSLHTTYLLEREQKEKMLHEYVDTHNRMLAITGHEMRNPLENFKFMLNMQHSLQESMNADEAAQMNLLLKKQLNGMFDLLNNLTEWGKLQLEPVERKPFAINVHDRVNTLLENIKAEAMLKGNKLFNQISPKTIIMFEADAFDFILRNLLNNANKFTQNGTITVASNITPDYRHCISVTDTGIGMTEKEVNQLLTQTGKLSKVGTHNEKGSGLGFALVREFLTRHHSCLTIKSKPKQGTCISFCL